MSLELQSALVFWVTLALYGIAIAYLLFRKRPFFAGVVSLPISLLPVLWQVSLTDSEAPGFAFLFVTLAPISLLLILIGSLAGVIRLMKGEHK